MNKPFTKEDVWIIFICLFALGLLGYAAISVLGWLWSVIKFIA